MLRQSGLRRRREETLLCELGNAVLRDGMSGRALACAFESPAARREEARPLIYAFAIVCTGSAAFLV
jgi:hypothetical protein